jgi:transcriptional regulator with XRE-family HTH domain
MYLLVKRNPVSWNRDSDEIYWGLLFARVKDVDETTNSEIDRHRIGRKLRQLRIRKSLSLAELAAHSGLSPALLSKVETGKMVPTIPTLTRVALVFGVGLEHFFSGDNSACSIVKRADRMRLEVDTAEPPDSVAFESLDYPAKEKLFGAYLAVFEPGETEATIPEHQHDGVEFIYVVKGTLGLRHDGVDHELRAGDSTYFKARLAHAYRRIGKARCEAVVVVKE